MYQQFQENELKIILRAMQFNQETVEKEYDTAGMSTEFLAVKAKVQKELDDIAFETEQKRRAEAEDAMRSEMEGDEDHDA